MRPEFFGPKTATQDPHICLKSFRSNKDQDHVLMIYCSMNKIQQVVKLLYGPFRPNAKKLKKDLSDMETVRKQTWQKTRRYIRNPETAIFHQHHLIAR